MELNPRNRETKKKVVNPEGSLVLERRPEVQLYLEASNLNLKKNAFYTKSEDKLKNLMALADKQDPAYVLGLAKFLADKGLKTSPVVLLSLLATKNFSFHQENVGYIFNTPKRIAEAVALQNLGLAKLNNSFKKHVLKASLESMSSHTLKKGKMRNNKIKVRDLIKLLRPKPRNAERITLFKDLIENRKVGLKEAGANMVQVKSSTTLTKEQKKEQIAANVEDIPINEMIRNLKFLADEYDFDNNIELQKKIVAKLSSIQNYRFLNIFDIITAAIYVPSFEKALHQVVKNFISNIGFKFEGDASVLFDISGSMMGDADTQDNLMKGFLYLVIFSHLFNVRLDTFADDLTKHSSNLDKVVALIQKGSYAEGLRLFRAHAKQYTGGTALLSSASELLQQEHRVAKNFIIISDEVSWKEGDNLLGDIDKLSNDIGDRNMIVINPSVYKGTVMKKNIIAVSSLTASIFVDMAILADEQGFINHIKNYKKVESNGMV